MNMAAELINEVLQQDLEQAETAVRAGDQATALSCIEQTMVKLNTALSVMANPERTHGSAGPIV